MNPAHYQHPIILIGYDVEARSASGDDTSTRLFLEKAVPLHSSFKIPCTAFILGQTLMENIESFQQIRGDSLWDIQQHSFSHIAFRQFGPASQDLLLKSGVDPDIDVIRQEVSKANELFREILGITCRGICAPKGYFNGLRGRADILTVLESHGIRFVRSYGRNEKHWQPVSFHIQPFWYIEDGFPQILEIPIQGWQDTIWRRVFGWDNKSGFLQYLRESVEYVTQNHLIWSCCFHDWSCVKNDVDLDIMKEFFEYALKKGAVFLSHLDFFEMIRKEKEQIEYSLC